jgi:hypothetical protein
VLKAMDRMDRLAAGIDEARARTLHWFGAMQADGQPKGVMRISAAHDASVWPGMLLPGAYNGIMCFDLLGGLQNWANAERRALVHWLEAHRQSNGCFRLPGMNEADVFKKPDHDETWRYIDWHVTNYSLGAVDALEPGSKPQLGFAAPYLDPLTLKAWLADRDLRDPWQEGNNIVNLASFLLLMRRDSDTTIQARVGAALDILYGWHDRLREPTTGFWGVGQLSDKTRMLHAFAGSMHNFHIWYHEARTLEGQNRAVDYCLSLPPAIDSACIDVDAVDVLIHGWRLIDHRRAEIEAWLGIMLDALLAFQNPDGGFCDVRQGIRRQDGWVKGYEEPHGLSNTFATWFRWIAIAMISDVLWPGRWSWNFRRMIGIGYRMADWHRVP